NTILTNYASTSLQSRLHDWGYHVVTVPVTEFLLAGGAVKCLTLYLDQDLGPNAADRGPFASQMRTTRLSITGHLLDTGLLNRAIDVVNDAGGSCHIEEFAVGAR